MAGRNDFIRKQQHNKMEAATALYHDLTKNQELLPTITFKKTLREMDNTLKEEEVEELAKQIDKGNSGNVTMNDFCETLYLEQRLKGILEKYQLENENHPVEDLSTTVFLRYIFHQFSHHFFYILITLSYNKK